MTPQDGTFAAVIRAYLQSPKYDSLSASTRAQYKYLLGLAAHPRTLGSLTVAEIRPKLVQAFLDGLVIRQEAKRIGGGALSGSE